MNRKSSDYRSFRILAAIVAVIIVLVPFHAFMTVWASSFVGHYTALRLWKEILLLIAFVIAIICSVRNAKNWTTLWRSNMWRLIAVYVLFVGVAGVIAYLSGAVTIKAMLYGVLLDTRPFIMLFVAWVAATAVPWLYSHWRRLLLLPAMGVVGVGLLQRFALPYDVMKHFGYNDQTISPYQTIDHKVEYIRIRSTLRGANLLGGYLLLILGALVALLTRKRRVVVTSIFIIASLIVLFASGSRGAWLGAVVAAGLYVWLKLPSRRAKQWALCISAASLLLIAVSIFALRNNDLVQNVVFHTDEHSTSQVSSNSAHVDYSIDAAKQIVTEPFGRGPGTAGPAGFYNAGHPARIAENYFLQIGQELGWIGMGLFMAIYAAIARRLWHYRKSDLGLTLLTSFAGLTVVALLMHIWTDDTIAYLWFGLAGILFAQDSQKTHAKAR